MEITKIGGGRQAQSRQVVTASRSRRWTLKEYVPYHSVRQSGVDRACGTISPSNFLSEMLLEQNRSKETLRKWVTLMNFEYLLTRFSGRRPRICLLTGLIEMENATVVIADSQSPSGTVGLGTSALTSPAGFSIHATASFRSALNSSQNQRDPRAHIYAARYQMLDVEYVRTSAKKGATPDLGLPCVALGQIFSMGTVKGDGRDKGPNAATLTCREVQGGVELEPLDEEYWTEFRKAAEDYID